MAMRDPILRLHQDDLIVDNFAGGGGASLGIEWALGRSPDIAVNHDPEAVAMHKLISSVSKWTLGDVRRILREYEALLPDEARELVAYLAERGPRVVDWDEDAETMDPAVMPPWEEQWKVERLLANGRWAHVVTIPFCREEGEAIDRAFEEGFRGRDFGRTWRVREVGDVHRDITLDITRPRLQRTGSGQ
jgi:hypothetical protein